jgi:hypothetical protein
MHLLRRRQRADNAGGARATDEANAPRCDLMSRPDGGRCLAQGAGVWRPSKAVSVVLCDDDQRELDDLLRGMGDEWTPFLSTRDRERIAERLERMAAGAFG